MEAAGFSWQGVGRPTWHLPVTESRPSSISRIPAWALTVLQGMAVTLSRKQKRPGVLALGRPELCPGLGIILGMGVPGSSASAQHPWFPEGSPHASLEYLPPPQAGSPAPAGLSSQPILESPRSASAPWKTLPEWHVVTATALSPVSWPCPPGSPSYGSSPPPMATSLPGCRDQLTAHPPRVHASVQGFPSLSPSRHWG